MSDLLVDGYMRITLIAIGSRGDVQPMLALGAGLQTNGHHVRLASHTNYASSARALGLAYAPISGDADAEFRLALRDEPGPLGQIRALLRVASRLQHQWLAQVWEASRDADAVVVSVLGVLPGSHVAEKLGVPLIRAFLSPLTPTGVSADSRPGAMKRLGAALDVNLFRLIRLVSWQPFRPILNAARRDVLGLAPLSAWEPFGDLDRRRLPLLYGFSPAIFPRTPDWGEWIHVTGFWFLDRPPDWQPAAELVDFLAAGPPPVFVGFGSNTSDRGAHSEQKTQLIADAVVAAGQRGILVRGSGGLGSADLPPGVIAVDSVPYDWLFPRMAALVHHGGSGTTAMGLRAGIPVVTIPSVSDQTFWSKRLHALGLGPPPLALKKLSVERLSHAIRLAATDSSMRCRAARLADRIHAEDGVQRAVELIEGRR